MEKEKIDWYVYTIAPIDWMWPALTTIEMAETMIARSGNELDEQDEDDGSPTDPLDSKDARQFRHDLGTARALAEKCGWEGDFLHGGPRVFWLPDPDYNIFRYAFVWKQANNGTTFVISPLPLTWLDR